MCRRHDTDVRHISYQIERKTIAKMNEFSKIMTLDQETMMFTLLPGYSSNDHSQECILKPNTACAIRMIRINLYEVIRGHSVTL